MNIKYVAGNFVLAVILFYFNGMLGKIQLSRPEVFEYGKFEFHNNDRSDFTGNFFLKIVNPTVFLAVAASLVQYVGKVDFLRSMWLLIPCYWIYRGLYIIVQNTYVFLNLRYEIFSCLLSHLLGEGMFFGVFVPLLNQKESIWIPPTALRDALWFSVIAYVFKTVWDLMKESFSGDKVYSANEVDKLVVCRYKKFAKRYGRYINRELQFELSESLNQKQICQIHDLVYAIMIYEDYNRPFAKRMMEYIIKFFRWKKVMSLGIMQVHSSKMISSKQSIHLAILKISESFYTKAPYAVYSATCAYNSGSRYLNEVSAIYEIICKEHDPKISCEQLV